MRGFRVSGFGVWVVRGFRVYGFENLADEVCLAVMEASMSWERVGRGRSRGSKS